MPLIVFAPRPSSGAGTHAQPARMPQPWNPKGMDAPVVRSGSAAEGGRCANAVCVRIGTGDDAALRGRSIGPDYRQRVRGTVRQERRDRSDPVWAKMVRATGDSGPNA